MARQINAPRRIRLSLPKRQIVGVSAADSTPTGRKRHEKHPRLGVFLVTDGAPSRSRTYDLCLRRAALYPAELWMHGTEKLVGLFKNDGFRAKTCHELACHSKLAPWGPAKNRMPALLRPVLRASRFEGLRRAFSALASVEWWPQQESNLHLSLRSALFYPLNYGAPRARPLYAIPRNWQGKPLRAEGFWKRTGMAS